MIRLATSKDINKIELIGNTYMPNFSKTYNLLNYLNDNKYIILVNEDQDINGFMIILKNIDYFELELIVVAENKRHQGISTKLFNYFLENYRKKGEEVLLEVAVNNKAAIALYNKFSFAIISTRKAYYDGIDAYVMKKVK